MIKVNQEYNELFVKAAKGNACAVDFLNRLAHLYRIWDDAYDTERGRDDAKMPSGYEISECFAEASFGFMDNKFYAAYRDMLWPQIMLSYNAWMDANDWTGHVDEKKKMCAAIIKEYCDEIVMLVAFICGGLHHMRSISKNVRELYLKGA